jgi:hypothetical protein
VARTLESGLYTHPGTGWHAVPIERLSRCETCRRDLRPGDEAYQHERVRALTCAACCGKRIDNARSNEPRHIEPHLIVGADSRTLTGWHWRATKKPRTVYDDDTLLAINAELGERGFKRSPYWLTLCAQARTRRRKAARIARRGY